VGSDGLLNKNNKGYESNRTEVLDQENERYSFLSSSPEKKTARDVQMDNQELEEQLVRDLDTTDVFRMRLRIIDYIEDNVQ
jgi:hypothetical protein